MSIDNIENEDDLEGTLEGALKAQVLPAWAWEERGRWLENQIELDLTSNSGRLDLIVRLATYGREAIKYLETLNLERNDPAWKQSLARCYSDGGEISGLMAAVVMGNVHWVKFLYKNGANIEWMDYKGNNVFSELLSEKSLNFLVSQSNARLPNMSDDQKNKSNIKITKPRQLIQWLKEQNEILQWLKNVDKSGQLGNKKNFHSETMTEIVRKNLDNIKQDYNFKRYVENARPDEEVKIDRSLLSCYWAMSNIEDKSNKTTKKVKLAM